MKNFWYFWADEFNFLLNFYFVQNTEAVTRGVLCKKVFLEISQNSQENSCPKAWNFCKKEALAQVFCCEFCEISKNTFFTEHLWTIGSKNK